MKNILTFLLCVMTIKLMAQTTNTSFMGIKLGEAETVFKNDYPQAQSVSNELLMVNATVVHDGMILHSITKVTSSGDPVEVDCYFKNRKLAVIAIEYSKYQSDNSVLEALAAKYGFYSKRHIYTYTDPINNQDRTEIVIVWTKFKDSILEYDSVEELGRPHFILANKQIQDAILSSSGKRTADKIE